LLRPKIVWGVIKRFFSLSHSEETSGYKTAKELLDFLVLHDIDVLCASLYVWNVQDILDIFDMFYVSDVVHV
jgi:hypothetical protein